MSTRARIVEAAVVLIEENGLRALSHRKIDAQAGLPMGSTKNYFKTAASLLEAATEGIMQRDLALPSTWSQPQTVDELVDGLVALTEVASGPYRSTTLARMLIFAESATNPAVVKTISRVREGRVDALTVALAHLGADSPRLAAQCLTSVVEGIVTSRLYADEPADLRALYSHAVRSLMR